MEYLKSFTKREYFFVLLFAVAYVALMAIRDAVGQV
jgi:hypothetical protein